MISGQAMTMKKTRKAPGRTAVRHEDLVRASTLHCDLTTRARRLELEAAGLREKAAVVWAEYGELVRLALTGAAEPEALRVARLLAHHFGLQAEGENP
jgi:endonuclease V-like protein UPF0215 family